MRRQRIAIDMDETICDSLSRHIEWYNRDFNTSLTKRDVTGMQIYQAVSPAHLDKVRLYPTNPDFFRDLPVIEGAVDAIKLLSEDYDIFFVTAAMEYPTSFDAKYQWLKKHFPFISDLHFVFCGFKGIINADYLIDDSPRHLDVFEGKGLLFNAGHNINAIGYHRVNNWNEVLAQLIGKRIG